VSRVVGEVQAGQLDALDVLVALATSSGLVTAVKVLPDILRFRKTGLSITTTIKGEQFQ
jgi:hypothetical protein